MGIAVRGYFDGKVIVPDEPIDLPVGERPEIDLRPAGNGERLLTDAEVKERLYWFRQLSVVSVPPIPDEALRRENMYEERL